MRFDQYEGYLKKFLEVKVEVDNLVQHIEELIAIADETSALSCKEQNSLKFHSEQLDNMADKIYNKKHQIEP